ncbi:MAG: alpha/beta hydrolase [Kofleriaceae bacterium]|nr:alpha/beta hydrolase [Kofleriaceae bacterium]
MKYWLLRPLARVALDGPIARVVARKRQGGRDEGLDPQVAAILEVERMMRLPPLESLSPAAARAHSEAGLAPLELPVEPMEQVIDTIVDGRRGRIPVRIFVPPDASTSWIVYLHGGGGVVGSIRAAEPFTRYLAARTKCTVASVDYRLGPEDKHPAGIDDACDAWDALAARIPAGGQAIVSGDSFGGFLALYVERHARRSARPVDLQVLWYPLLDLTLSSTSSLRYAEGYLLTRSMEEYFRHHYLNATDDRWEASPASWGDLAGTAPTIVATAGFDPLVDEGDQLASRLAGAGVQVQHRRYGSLIHGFVSLAGAVHAAKAAVDEVCDDLGDFASARTPVLR